MEQLSFFEDNKPLKCYEVSLNDITYTSQEELFFGFDEMRAITFSYSINFLSKILSNYKYAEIILGGDFLVQKDTDLFKAISISINTHAIEAVRKVRSSQALVDKILSEDLLLKSSTFILDHRKIYLLKSDTGKKRVIISSANASGRAWNGEQMESYMFSNDETFYDEIEKDFYTAWENSTNIPYNVIAHRKTKDAVNDNPIINKVKETEKAIVLQEAKPLALEYLKYTIDAEKLAEENKQLLCNIKSKKGLIEIVPDDVVKIYKNKAKLQKKKVAVKNVSHPSLVIDYDNDEIILNEQSLSLSPTEEEVKNDIDVLLEAFENFDKYFLKNTIGLKKNYFRIMNLLFASPFFAYLRNVCYYNNVPTDCYPLFATVTSEDSNCGKSFMIELFLKMMLGQTPPVYLKEQHNINTDVIRGMQRNNKGFPVFIDEYSPKQIGYIKESIIKAPDVCEKEQIENHPLFIFANNRASYEEMYRKRMAFFSFDSGLTEDMDRCAMKSIGLNLTKKISNGFYREYLRRIYPIIKDEINFISSNNDRPDIYYFDVLEKSSEIIMDIFQDYGNVPSFMSTLTWNNDYSSKALAEVDDIINEIKELYQSSPKRFIILDDKIVIEYGNVNDDYKRCKRWEKILPKEFDITITSTPTTLSFTMKKSAFEKKSGISIKPKFSLFNRR